MNFRRYSRRIGKNFRTGRVLEAIPEVAPERVPEENPNEPEENFGGYLAGFPR